MCVKHLMLLVTFLATAATNAGSMHTNLTGVIEADLGSRLALHCKLAKKNTLATVVWKKDGEALDSSLSWKIYRYLGVISSPALTLKDAGNYTCQTTTEPYQMLEASLILRTPPAKLSNLSILPSAMMASLKWKISSDGGYPITHFTLMYEQVLQDGHAAHHLHGQPQALSLQQKQSLSSTPDQEKSDNESLSSQQQQPMPSAMAVSPSTLSHNDSKMIPLSESVPDIEETDRIHLPVHISPAARQFFVYHLQPNAMYMFKMWATNRLGPGEPTVVYISTHPKHGLPNNRAGHWNHSESTFFKLNSNYKGDGDQWSSTAWLIAVSMVVTTLVILCLLSCVLIYQEGTNDDCSIYEELNISAAAVQVLLDPARTFRRFHRPHNHNGNSCSATTNEERSLLLENVDHNSTQTDTGQTVVAMTTPTSARDRCRDGDVVNPTQEGSHSPRLQRSSPLPPLSSSASSNPQCHRTYTQTTRLTNISVRPPAVV